MRAPPDRSAPYPCLVTGEDGELLRFTVRAKPGSRIESVTRAGNHEGVPLLDVKVRAKAVDGAANDAIVAAIASALGVNRRAVRIVRGHTGRLKHVHVVAGNETAHRLAALLAMRDG